MSAGDLFVDEPAAARLSRDVVRATGPDAVSFLQGQLSQDLEALQVGEAAWSFLLEPQGHLVALIRVIPATDGLLLVVDEGIGAAVVERLERFKLRVKAEIALADGSVWAVRGGAAAPDLGGIGQVAPAGDGSGGVDVVSFDGAAPGGLPEVPEQWHDACRIEAGIPVVGRDVQPGAIPAETGMVERAVSFTKGCYTGQELVARVDSRGGKAPHRLVGVLSDDAVEAGTALLVAGERAGEVTSAVGPPVRERHIALARVKRSVDVPQEASIGTDGRVARLVALPLVS